MGKTSSLKTILEQIKLLQKDKKIRLVITMAAVLLSAFIQAWAIQVFVRPAEIISGGFSGAAMLIECVGSLKGLTIPMQVTMILFKYPGSSYVLSWDQCPVYSGVTASGRIWKYIFADIFISAYFYR